MSDSIHIISLGAGVQSSTMALMAACGEITPMPTCAIFSDTQDEPQEVYIWLDWLEKQLPFPIHRVTIGKLSELATRVRLSKKTGLNYMKPSLPVYTSDGQRKGMMQRQCTLTAKIDPLNRKTKQIAGRGNKVTMWIGISRDEVVRMKPSREKNFTNTWPLVDLKMTREDCEKWMKEKGFPTPPRSACTYCPFHSDAEWLRIKTDSPKEFQSVVELEKRVQLSFSQCTRLTGVPYFHSSRKPLNEVDFSPKQNPQTDLFGNECEGMCGV